MTTEFGAWRASYTPGRWLVLSGPTTAVVLQPAPAEASAFVGEVWDSIVSAASISQVAERLAGFGLDAMPTLAVFFWDDAELHALLRGDIQVEDARTSRLLADGEGVRTWREVTLDTPVVRVILDPVPPDRLLQLPLVIGAASASTLVLDASDQLSRYSTQTESLVGAPFSEPALADELAALHGTPSHEPEQLVPTSAAAEAEEDHGPAGGLSWKRGAQVMTDAAGAAGAGLAGAALGAGAVVPPAASPLTPPIAAPLPAAGIPTGPGPSGPASRNEGSDLSGRQEALGVGEGSGESQRAASGREPGSAPQDWAASGHPASDAIPLADRATQLLPSTGFEPDLLLGPPSLVESTDEPDWLSSSDRPNAFMFEPTEALDNQAPESTGLPEPPSASEPVAVGGDHVLATICPSGHPNQPGTATCRVCGQGLDARAVQLIPTPVLARLVVSSGEVIALSRPVLLGRAPVPPGNDTNVILVRLASPQHDISRTHCLISPRDWSVEVTDMGSTNGTVVTNPGQSPVPLEPHEPFVAELGAVVDVGDGQFVRIDPA